MNIYVGNLPISFSKDGLEELASEFGEIRSVSIIRDRDQQKSNGYGFVEFHERTDGEKAIDALNGKLIQGRKLKAGVAHEQVVENSSLEFTEEEILRLFGHEAAENEIPERLREYYFKGDTYNQLIADLPLRVVVGHKGIGKSAMFQVAMLEYESNSELTLLIQPSDITELTTNDTDFLRAIRDWKDGLTGIIASKILVKAGAADKEVLDRAKRWGGKIIDFASRTLRGQIGDEMLPGMRLIIKKYLESGKIRIFIDDLDRGWEGRPSDVRRISALLNAVRDISTDQRGVQFRISLRSDVYYLVRTSDESTDKIEGSVVWLSWTNHEIFALLAKRIETFFGNKICEEELRRKSQRELALSLRKVMEPRFSGRGHWANAPMHRVLMSLIRKRPRDLVKLCWGAAREARKDDASIIRTKHLLRVFEDYSQGRLQDTYNEYRSEFPEIERLLSGMRPTKLQRRAKEGYLFSTDSLVKKIRDIEQGGTFRFAGSNKLQHATHMELVTFMYKINFLTARMDTPAGPIRRYFEENRYLANTYVDYGFAWEIHPAYRWALQPQQLEDIFESLELTADTEEEESTKSKKRHRPAPRQRPTSR